MRRISDSERLNYYINKFKLNTVCNKSLLGAMELFSFSDGELIYSKGSRVSHVYFLVEGKLKIYILHDNGKSVLLRFNKPLSLLGDVEFMTDYRAQAHVESLNETLLLGLPMDFVREHAGQDAVFLRFLLKNLSQKLYTTTGAISLNLLYPVETRLACYILSINDSGEASSNTDEIRTSNLTELATLLGTSYRHLNRVVNDFVSRGIIQKKRGVITIKNLEKLKELSNGNLYE